MVGRGADHTMTRQMVGLGADHTMTRQMVGLGADHTMTRQMVGLGADHTMTRQMVGRGADHTMTRLECPWQHEEDRHVPHHPDPFRPHTVRQKRVRQQIDLCPHDPTLSTSEDDIRQYRDVPWWGVCVGCGVWGVVCGVVCV